MTSLNIALFVLFNTHVLVFTFSSAITSSFLLLHLSIIPGESDHVSYMTDKSSCIICKVKSCLGSSLCRAHYSRIYPCILICILIPSLSYLILLVSPFLYLVPSHSCDSLEDLLPSSSQYGFSSALLDDEDREF